MSEPKVVLHEWELAGYCARIVEEQPGIVSSQQAMDDDTRGRLWLANRAPFGWQNEMIHLAMALAELRAENERLRAERDEAMEVARGALGGLCGVVEEVHREGFNALRRRIASRESR